MRTRGNCAEICVKALLFELPVGVWHTMQVAGEKTYSFEGHTLDLMRGSLRTGDREVALRPKSFEVLRYLLENAGQLASKEDLIKAVWPNVSVADEAVTRCVSDVRLALGDVDQRIIKTVLKRGYIFIAPIERIQPDGVEAPLQTPPTRALSLAILPFVNLSGDVSQEYLVDGITEGLTTYLSLVPDSFVIARSTALNYKRRPFDARQIGRELGVRYLIEGSHLRGGTRDRISAQLISAETGAHLWADQFDADRTDLLDLLDEVVTRLARAIQIELAKLEAARISRAKQPTVDSEDLARSGEAIFLRYGPNRDEAESSYQFCERAIAADPRNARALSILAEKFATRVTASQSTDRDADLRRATELVSRALASDPDFYYAHHANARILMAQRRPEQALVEAERSLALNPSFIPAYQIVCMANIFLGRAGPIIAYADKALQLSPLDPYRYIFCAFKAYGHVMLGHHDRAIEYLRQAVANNPDFPTPIAWLTALLAIAGNAGEAEEMLTRYLALRSAKTRTITQWKALAWGDNSGYLAFREKLYEGLRRAGMPEG
jgi:TolB-like protein